MGGRLVTERRIPVGVAPIHECLQGHVVFDDMLAQAFDERSVLRMLAHLERVALAFFLR